MACMMPFVCFALSDLSILRTGFEEVQPGQRTGLNRTRNAASAPVAPRCDVTASNSTQKEPGQPARFSFGSADVWLSHPGIGAAVNWPAQPLLNTGSPVPENRSSLLPQPTVPPAECRDCTPPGGSSTSGNR